MRREIPQVHKKPGTALVLSGGATKAFYFHLGVLKALGIQDFSAMVGSSAGAMVAALVAMGTDVDTLITA
ncbi:MAG: patatin-like phospholipase family protein, partial [Anaerolineae bacterium]|nr:patatin-like phospholipase family protein [Anaerolineae bacterium]